MSGYGTTPDPTPGNGIVARRTKTPASGPGIAEKDRGDWSLSWHGVKTVARLELTQRLRSTRWRTALSVWFVVVGVICTLISSATSFSAGYSGMPTGPLIFGLNVFFVLFLGLLVTPTLSSTAINGDRNAGTLAVLQVTLLTPLEITLGKLAAGWLASLAFLAVSVPFIAWAFFAGGVGILAVVTTILVLAVVLASVCAMSLAFSALVTKTSGSTLLSYLGVATLTFFSLVLFLLLLIPVTTEESVRELQASRYDDTTGEVVECEWLTVERTVVHTERTWWLLAANPFVVVADAAGGEVYGDAGFDPLAGIRDGVRAARAGADLQDSWSSCPTEISGEDEAVLSTAPVWPWGLGFLVLLGAGSVALTVTRIRIPRRTLARGTRIA